MRSKKIYSVNIRENGKYKQKILEKLIYFLNKYIQIFKYKQEYNREYAAN